MDQIVYDNLTPAEEPDVPQLGYVETALEMLEKAASAYRADPPRWSEGAGLVMDAVFELNKVN